MIDNYKGLIAGVAHEFPLIGQAILYHKNTRGQPMEYKDMPYLAPLYAELPKLKGADIKKRFKRDCQSCLFACPFTMPDGRGVSLLMLCLHFLYVIDL